MFVFGRISDAEYVLHVDWFLFESITKVRQMWKQTSCAYLLPAKASMFCFQDHSKPGTCTGDFLFVLYFTDNVSAN